MPISRSPALPVSGAPSYSPNSLPVYRGGAAAASAPTPSDIASIVDWGVFSDLTRLAQNAAGTVPVVAVNDPVAFWRGQLDVLTFTQGVSANCPKYAADGVYYYPSGNTQTLAAPYTKAHDTAFGISHAATIEVGGTNKEPLLALSLNATYAGAVTGELHSGNELRAYVKLNYGLLSTGTGEGARSAIIGFNGTTASARFNGVDKSVTVGTYTSTTNYLVICSSSAVPDGKSKGWVVLSAQPSASDIEILETWMAGL